MPRYQIVERRPGPGPPGPGRRSVLARHRGARAPGRNVARRTPMGNAATSFGDSSEVDMASPIDKVQPDGGRSDATPVSRNRRNPSNRSVWSGGPASPPFRVHHSTTSSMSAMAMAGTVSSSPIPSVKLSGPSTSPQHLTESTSSKPAPVHDANTHSSRLGFPGTAIR